MLQVLKLRPLRVFLLQIKIRRVIKTAIIGRISFILTLFKKYLIIMPKQTKSICSVFNGCHSISFVKLDEIP